jgi:ribonuclease HI
MVDILIACDGSSHRKADKTIGGAIGWAWARQDGAWQSSAFFEGTNQRAELHAVRSVLLFHPQGKMKVQLDSQYALNVTEKWAYGWEKRNWVKPDGKPVLNRDIIEHILFLRKKRKDPVEFEWVKGHLKDNRFPLNTLADKYAGEASERAKKVSTAEESLLLYRDSKGRTSINQETEMMKRIISFKG